MSSTDGRRGYALECGLPLRHSTVQLGHGGGGRLQRELLERVVLPALVDARHDRRHDAAVCEVGGARVACTTDTFVVSPRFFPGGDIGSLAVYGTVNDLACSGARPIALSCALVLEEGFAMDELSRVLQSMRRAADRCGVSIVTGDLKVVDRGGADGLFINTSGIGAVELGLEIHPRAVRPGDVVLLSGDIGRHGVAVMSARPGVEFETSVESDAGPVHELVRALLAAGLRPHCLRDPTRGGVAAALNEIALDSGCGFELSEAEVPVSEPVASACELLGLDPLYVACEGRLLIVLPEAEGEPALEVLRASPEGAGATRVGVAVEQSAAPVVLRTRLSTRRVLDLPAGALLPRIC